MKKPEERGEVIRMKFTYSLSTMGRGGKLNMDG